MFIKYVQYLKYPKKIKYRISVGYLSHYHQLIQETLQKDQKHKIDRLRQAPIF